MSTTPDLSPTPTVAIRQAATVVLLRDSVDGMQVLLVRRHGQSSFMPDATVFPGGKVDPEDAAAAWAGPEPAVAGLAGADARAFLVAAARELHEEAHVLLAVDGAGCAVDPNQVNEFTLEVESARRDHRLPSAHWHRSLRARDWHIDGRALAIFAHWLTPEAEPRRFDTYFAVALLPAGQRATLDPHETTELTWISPASALVEHRDAGSMLLPPPTQHTLQRLTHWSQSERAWAQLLLEGPGPLILPWYDPSEPASVMPWDPGHPDCGAWLARHGHTVPRMTGVAPSQLPCRDRFVVQIGKRTQRQTDA